MMWSYTQINMKKDRKVVKRGSKIHFIPILVPCNKEVNSSYILPILNYVISHWCL